jgi:hypothetical protein
LPEKTINGIEREPLARAYWHLERIIHVQIIKEEDQQTKSGLPSGISKKRSETERRGLGRASAEDLPLY